MDAVKPIPINHANNSLSTIAAVVTNSLASSGLLWATPLGLLLTTGMVSVTTIDNLVKRIYISPVHNTDGRVLRALSPLVFPPA